MLVLYNPRSNAQRKPIVPYALLALGASVEGRHDYAIVDGNLEHDAASLIARKLAEGGPPILGVTSMPGPQVVDAVGVVGRVKSLVPAVRTVWGGYFPTQHVDACLRSPLVDVAVRGHADVAFPHLIDALTTNADVSSLPGVAVRGSSARIPEAPIPRASELAPFPWHRVQLERYVRSTVLGRRTLGYHASYGCPYVCNFCAVVNMVGGRWTGLPAERVADDVARFVERHQADAVEFYDNNFFVQEGRTVEIAERITHHGLTWWGEARIDGLMKYSDASLATMARSGLRMVFCGAESGDAETLARMDKGGTLTPEMTLDFVARAKAFGIVPELSFVLGSPPDPEGDIDRTLAFIRKVKARNPATEIILYLYTPEPVAGPLWDQAQAAGFAFPTTLEAWAAFEDVVQRRSERLPWLPTATRRRVRGFERVLNAYYPTTTDVRLTGPRRALLRALSAWRWHLQFYRAPLELAAAQRLLRYQRPETAGF